MRGSVLTVLLLLTITLMLTAFSVAEDIPFPPLNPKEYEPVGGTETDRHLSGRIITIEVKISGLEGNDTATITIVSADTGLPMRTKKIGSTLYSVHVVGNGLRPLAMGASLYPPEDGDYVMEAYAEGYGVTPAEGHEFTLPNAIVEQRQFDFVFQKIS